MNEHHFLERISVKPTIHFGKPCVVGTRIPVRDVLELIDHGISFETIIVDYFPDLELADIRACLRYAMALIANEDIHFTPIPA